MKSVAYNKDTDVIDFSVAQYPRGMPNAGPMVLHKYGLKVVEIGQLVGWGGEVLLVHASAFGDDGSWLPSVRNTHVADALNGYWVLNSKEAEIFRAMAALPTVIGE